MTSFLKWEDLENVLGKEESSIEFTAILEKDFGNYVISEDPFKYNDVSGHTKYYKFLNYGMEFGFRNKILNHIHLFLIEKNGYEKYKGDTGRIDRLWREPDIFQVFGKPNAQGGGYEDLLLGYVNRWIKYNFCKYSIHIEQSSSNGIQQISLIAIL